jgi:hypothetical protein
MESAGENKLEQKEDQRQVVREQMHLGIRRRVKAERVKRATSVMKSVAGGLTAWS